MHVCLAVVWTHEHLIQETVGFILEQEEFLIVIMSVLVTNYMVVLTALLVRIHSFTPNWSMICLYPARRSYIGKYWRESDSWMRSMVSNASRTRKCIAFALVMLLWCCGSPSSPQWPTNHMERPLQSQKKDSTVSSSVSSWWIFQ